MFLMQAHLYHNRAKKTMPTMLCHTWVLLLLLLPGLGTGFTTLTHLGGVRSSTPLKDATQLWQGIDRQVDPHLERIVISRMNVEERLVDRNSKSVEVEEGVFVDSLSAISKDLLHEVQKKAIAMEMTFVDTEENNSFLTFSGMAGLYRDADGRLCHVTARHNVRGDYEKPNVEFVRARCSSPYLISQRVCLVDFQPSYADATHEMARHPEKEKIPIRPNLSLTASCYDVAQGDRTVEFETCDGEKGSTEFEFVPCDFELEVGMKVGMVVYQNFAIGWDDVGVNKIAWLPFVNTVFQSAANWFDWEDDEMITIYGKPMSACVYPGEILATGAFNGLLFEHSINSFKGCSGAIIFLLDENQDSCVDKEFYGKAIGVHTGRDFNKEETNNCNIGFRVDEKVMTELLQVT